MNIRSGKIYLKESVLDSTQEGYAGGNMNEMDCSAIYIYRDGVEFEFKGYKYFTPFENIKLIRFLVPSK